jgi:hypothetical protein
MRNLEPPCRDDVRAHLIKALKQGQRDGVPYGYPVTAVELDAVIALYDAYDATRGVPAPGLKGPALDVDLKRAVQRGYAFTQEGRKLSVIRSLVMAGVEHCPVCEISPPTELDHYLPQGDYKALAIYVRNLVPHCHQCNNKKNAHVGHGDNERFIHAYFDTLPNIQFFRANIEIVNNGLDVDFEIAEIDGLQDDVRVRLEYQLSHLALNDRYRKEINPYLTSQVTALHMASEAKGAAGVAEYLSRQAIVERQRFHLNHWRPIFARSIVTASGVLRWLS